MHKAWFSVVGYAVQNPIQHALCTVTAIGLDFDSETSEKHGIKCADRLLKIKRSEQRCHIFMTK